LTELDGVRIDVHDGLPVTPLVVGFTGARYDQQSLVNLNGRIYDAFTGRFLSKDPHNSAPGNSQSYNRYAYVWNMPLDPSTNLVDVYVKYVRDKVDGPEFPVRLIRTIRGIGYVLSGN